MLIGRDSVCSIQCSFATGSKGRPGITPYKKQTCDNPRSCNADDCDVSEGSKSVDNKKAAKSVSPGSTTHAVAQSFQEAALKGEEGRPSSSGIAVYKRQTRACDTDDCTTPEMPGRGKSSDIQNSGVFDAPGSSIDVVAESFMEATKHAKPDDLLDEEEAIAILRNHCFPEERIDVILQHLSRQGQSDAH